MDQSGVQTLSGTIRSRALISAGLIALYAGLAWSAGMSGQVPGMDTALVAALGAALIALSVIDIETHRLPDVLTLPLIAIGLVAVALISAEELKWHAAAALAGYLVFVAIEQAFLRLRGYPGLGRGDAKLLAGAGAWLGFEGIPSTILIASLLALAVMLLPLLRGGALDPKRRLAFGPFLALAIWVVRQFGPVL